MKVPVQSLLSIALGLLIETLGDPNANSLQLISAQARGNLNAVTVTFSVPVSESTATNPANYAVNNGATVSNVTIIEAAKSPMHTSRSGRAISLFQLPLHFEANEGQTDSRVKFFARGKGSTLFLTPGEVVLHVNRPVGTNANQATGLAFSSGITNDGACSSTLRMKLRGADSNPCVEGQDRVPGKVNYFKGNDSTK